MAVIYDMAQGSDEWFAARLGKPTASEMHRVITAAKGEPSKSADKYAHALVAETLLGRSLAKSPGVPWAMARGKQYEPMAVAQYASDNGVEVRRVGLVTTNDGLVAASPDGLIVGTRGGLEVKCVLDDNHVGIWAEGPGDDFRQQVQGNLAVCELEWWDLYCWHPELPPITIRTYRDEPFIARLGVALASVLATRDALLARAFESGWAARPCVALPATFNTIAIAA